MPVITSLVGRRGCQVCDGTDGLHVAECPVLALEAEMQALAAAVGLFVADMRERLETLDRLLHGGSSAS
jgi:hypothetical protein